MSSTKKPSHLAMRIYKVGFGDCTLLTFHYSGGDERYLLIDFGSTKTKSGKITKQLEEVAEDIHKVCGGKLHGVVASHRHQDHIRGFSTKANRKGPGDIIKKCSPKVVIQPWTENPALKTDAYSAKALAGGAAPDRSSAAVKALAYVASLENMQAFAAHAKKEARHRRSSLSEIARRQLAVYGEINLPNLKAVRNLRNMGPNKYVRYGTPLRLQRIFPGVTFKALGPPDLTQSEDIFGHRADDPDEFWQLAGFWAKMALNAIDSRDEIKVLFPDTERYSAKPGPHHTRWFTRRIDALHGDQLASIVRILDKSLNNTSVILFIKFGNTKMLFPGDAQIENWSYALGKRSVKQLLSGIHVYKVGHHGSRNATPKTLWNNFKYRNAPIETRLCTILSTLPDVHGSAENRTEVPRRTLVRALGRETTLIRTDRMRDDELVEEWEIQP